MHFIDFNLKFNSNVIMMTLLLSFINNKNNLASFRYLLLLNYDSDCIYLILKQKLELRCCVCRLTT